MPARPRLLVIDDNADILDVLSTMLASEFDVATATSGFLALDRFRAGESFDAVLCDLMMPGMTGMELFEAVSEHYPRLASVFLFMSGGSQSVAAAEFMQKMSHRVVDKPFEPRVLRALLHAIAKSGGKQTKTD